MATYITLAQMLTFNIMRCSNLVNFVRSEAKVATVAAKVDSVVKCTAAVDLFEPENLLNSGAGNRKEAAAAAAAESSGGVENGEVGNGGTNRGN
jgi:hypothetical protein